MSERVILALVQCPGWGRECPPYALACLSAYARREGFEVSCFDLNNSFREGSAAYRAMWDDKDYYSFWENQSRLEALIRDNGPLLESFVDRITACGARVVGFSTHTTSFLVSLEVARRLKARDPSLIVLFGGPQCSRAQAGLPLAAEPCVDAVVVGEGEVTLVEILRSLENGRGLRPLPGMIMKVGGRVQDCGDRELIADLDTLPIPDYSDFDEDIKTGRYNSPDRLDIFESRGCVRTCHFCSEWQFWRRFRSMSGERIFQEVREQIERYPQVDHFYFIGSLLNGSMKTLERFCDLMIESGLKVRWEGQAIVNPGMDERMLAKMAKAGCEWLGFGIESGSERLRWTMNKKFTNENAFKTLKAAHEAGIRSQINIMFGLPTETREDFEQTLRFLARVRPHIETVLASQSFSVLDKGTEPQVHPERFGIRGEEHHLFWSSNQGENDYPERFRRYEEFCKLAIELGVPETSGVLLRKPDKWQLLGEYYQSAGEFVRAIGCFRRSLRLESKNRTVMENLALCYEAAGRPDRALACRGQGAAPRSIQLEPAAAAA
ncbi:MAG: radical SAM protein [Elusimicrobia bacterium]|nr:radical SAM protein [Elusimicrobiota bacterium]